MRLEADGLFFMACCDAFRDGSCEVEESQVLSALRAALDLPAETAIRMARDAAALAPQSRSQQPPMEPLGLFQSACQIAAADGRVEESELALLRTLAGCLGIPGAVAARILADVSGT